MGTHAGGVTLTGSVGVTVGVDTGRLTAGKVATEMLGTGTLGT